MNTTQFFPEAADLLASAGHTGAFKMERVTGGGNNRVYRIQGDRLDAVLKMYFQHPNDPRNRLHAEFSFSQFAWARGVRSLARPIACDEARHLGLYEYVPGRRLLPLEIGAAAVRQAVTFVTELNQFKHAAEASALPQAAEACFSLNAHLQCVTRRIDRLLRAQFAPAKGPEADLDREAEAFIQHDLAHAWQQTAAQVEQRAAELGLPLPAEIALEDRCLSPSDFGFHNALQSAARLRFIDFEYAGWDDPAKLVCDFFCQPAVPVPLEYWQPVITPLVAGLSDPALHEQRIALLWPVYQLKWCCILLNDFLPVDNQRRQFAQVGEGEIATERQARKSRQLQKSRVALQKLQTVSGEAPC
jgi:hypothetical protein